MKSDINYHTESINCDTEHIALPLEEKTLPISRHLDKSPSYHEEYDEDGEVVRVGNLHFTDKILGSGAYAQVVLARRVTNCEIPSDSSSRNSIPSMMTRGSFNSSIKLSSSLENVRDSKSSSGKSCEDDDDKVPQSKKDEFVAVKIYSKSLLKRMRNIRRGSNLSEKRLIEVHTALENVEREIALMKQMRHPNLVSLLQVIDSVDSDALYVVLEFVPLGEIMTFDPDTQRFRHRHRHTPGLTKDGYFLEDFAALFFVDVLHGLAYLHRNCICHRDLKPENILMTKNGVAKISDFGVSHFFEEERDKLSIRSSMNSFNRDDLSISTMDYSEATDTRPTKLTRYDTDSALEMDNLSTSGILRTTEGTYPFWSPEMCNGNSSFSGYASDLWAAGVCLYIFTSGRLPFYSESPSTLFQMISSQEKVPLQGLGFSSQLKDLLSQVMNKDPSARAGVGDCLKHEFCTLARMERMKLLGENIRQSTETTITVNTEDKHKAFSIARVAKAAQHKMSKRFQLAREAFATSRPSRISHAFSTLSSSSWMDLTERKKRFIKSISTLSAGAGRAGGKGDTKFHSPKLFKKSLSQIKKMHSSTSATTTSAIVEDSNDDDDENDDKDHDAASTLSNSSGRSKCIVM